jgi:beta-galactosidase
MDIMRLPKFAFYFYQSQAGPNLNPNAKFDKPMVYIANYWSDSTYKNVTVYSNCEEVELLVNNKLLSRQKPLKGKYSENLVHAPFQFEIKSFQKGTISAAGFINGKVAAIDQRTTPGTPNGILLRIDESGKSLQSGCNDILFLYASVIDEKEGLIPDANNLISFNIEGEGTLIGQNPVKAEAGIATILIKAGMKPGVLKIRANAAKLKEKIIEVHVE